MLDHASTDKKVQVVYTIKTNVLIVNECKAIFSQLKITAKY